jgi:hypothetical protein
VAIITTEYDPNICQCCGASTTASVLCVCTAYNDWHQTENGEVACGYHKADLYLKTERKTVALGVAPVQSNDRWRNFR